MDARTTTVRRWIPTRIENLEIFDVVYHSHAVWVIQAIRVKNEYREIDVTRVDDGKKSKWTFSPFSSGYLVEKLS